MSSLPSLVIRADGSSERGLGHVMRTLALAQAWLDRGGPVTYAVGELPDNAESRLRSERIAVHRLAATPGTEEDWNETSALAAALGAEWVACDGYHFDATYQRGIQEAGRRLLFLDDYGHCDAYSADLVLNQDICAAASMYKSVAGGTRLLLGMEYALIRREFREARPLEGSNRPNARRLLITLGGGDQRNVTRRLLSSLAGPMSAEFRIEVVLGGAYPYGDPCEGLDLRGSITIHRGVGDMAPLMGRADMAVSGGGSTTTELCYMGVPTLALIVAENQRLATEALAEAGALRYLDYDSGVPEQHFARAIHQLAGAQQERADLSATARRLVDGRGAERVMEAMGIAASEPAQRRSECG